MAVIIHIQHSSFIEQKTALVNLNKNLNLATLFKTKTKLKLLVVSYNICISNVLDIVTILSEKRFK